MYKIEYLEPALEDIHEIVSYISNELSNREVAIKLTEKIINKGNMLADFPYGRPVYIPIKKLQFEYRSIKVDNYLLFYFIDEDKKKVLIARVIYSKREIPNTIK